MTRIRFVRSQEVIPSFKPRVLGKACPIKIQTHSLHGWSYGMASPIDSPFKLHAVKVPEVPDIDNLISLLLTSIGKESKSFSQELIQEFGFLKLHK